MTLLDHLRELFTKHADTLGNPFLREAIDTLARYESAGREMPEEPVRYSPSEALAGEMVVPADQSGVYVPALNYSRLCIFAAAQTVRADENERDARRFEQMAGANWAKMKEFELDAKRLATLFEISNRESDEGEWMVTLKYNNSQDGAHVLDGNGKSVGECYDLDKEPDDQFRAAIDAALKEQKT